MRDEEPAIVADEQGWTWTARVRPRLYQWTRLSLERHLVDRDWLPEEFQGLKRWSKTRGADVTWRAVRAAAGRGYFLVGDAAAVLDPASSHGVLKAMMSGMMAAHLIAQIINHGQMESRVIHAYCQWVGVWFEHDVVRLRELYALLPHPLGRAWSDLC
jgi:hypothetical protein